MKHYFENEGVKLYKIMSQPFFFPSVLYRFFYHASLEPYFYYQNWLLN